MGSQIGNNKSRNYIFCDQTISIRYRNGLKSLRVDVECIQIKDNTVDVYFVQGKKVNLELNDERLYS